MLKPNPTIAAMASYALPDISAADGLDAIVLAQNEHPFAPSQAVVDAVNTALASAQLYPDSDCNALRAAIAGVHGLDAERIVCGSGSMELMSSLMLAYLSPAERISMSEYGYLFMRTLVKQVGAGIDIAAETNYRVNIDALLASLQPNTRLVFVVNPGNPSGTVIHNDEIRRLRAALPEDVLLLVDEAYGEFVDADFHAPLFDLAESSNTVITRTFSKIYGLAGLRVGWGYFPIEIRDQVRKVINPGSVSSLSQAAACAAMQDQAHATEARGMIARQRAFLSAALSGLGLTVLPSQTNFILVDFASTQRAGAAFQFLRQHRLVVRPMAGYGLPTCLRITLGTPGQMRLTADTLAEWRKGNND
jgi:histidinol-phosphate aminotransferase